MNTIKQGILMAASGFIASAFFSYFTDGRINWISSVFIASGFFGKYPDVSLEWMEKIGMLLDADKYGR